MTKYEVGILVVGGLAGWWVISYLFDRKKAPGTGADESGDARGSAAGGVPSPTGTGDGLAVGPRVRVASRQEHDEVAAGLGERRALGVDRGGRGGRQTRELQREPRVTAEAGSWSVGRR